MSKEKPEIEDVWRDEYGEKAHILWVGYVVVYVRKYWITNYEYHYEVCKLDYDRFIRKWTYLGKSKANIEELFEIDENIHQKENLATDLKQIVRESMEQVRKILGVK